MSVHDHDCNNAMQELEKGKEKEEGNREKKKTIQ